VKKFKLNFFRQLNFLPEKHNAGKTTANFFTFSLFHSFTYKFFAMAKGERQRQGGKFQQTSFPLVVLYLEKYWRKFMGRIILGAVLGFVVWTVLWVGSDAVFMAISTSYREYMEGFQKALDTKQPFEINSVILFLTLLKSFICSIISGLITAIIAKENFKSTLLTGVLLLAFGIFVQSVMWSYLPLWYHLPFLILLIPMTVLGGKFHKVKEVHNF
jgi:hypothetical protein